MYELHQESQGNPDDDLIKKKKKGGGGATSIYDNKLKDLAQCAMHTFLHLITLKIGSKDMWHTSLLSETLYMHCKPVKILRTNEDILAHKIIQIKDFSRIPHIAYCLPTIRWFIIIIIVPHWLSNSINIILYIVKIC